MKYDKPNNNPGAGRGFKITMTPEILRHNDYALWSFLAKTGKKKEDWGGFKTLYSISIHLISPPVIESRIMRCFCCWIGGSDCKSCPKEWSKLNNSVTLCHSTDSPYRKWEKAKTAKIRKKYAAIIRDMPWRMRDE